MNMLVTREPIYGVLKDAHEPMRVGLHGAYRIFYVVTNGIEIVRIIHQSRDLTAEQFN